MCAGGTWFPTFVLPIVLTRAALGVCDAVSATSRVPLLLVLAGLALRFAGGQRVYMLHARRHFAPHGILAVEEAGIVEADEELRIGAVGVHRPRHRADATHMRLTAEFGGKIGLVRAAGAGAGLIAALRHEAGDDAVEDDAAVKAFAGEVAEDRT